MKIRLLVAPTNECSLLSVASEAFDLVLVVVITEFLHNSGGASLVRRRRRLDTAVVFRTNGNLLLLISITISNNHFAVAGKLRLCTLCDCQVSCGNYTAHLYEERATRKNHHKRPGNNPAEFDWIST